MSATQVITCDYCGLVVEDDHVAEVAMSGRLPGRNYFYEYRRLLGHYHTDPRPSNPAGQSCWDRYSEAMTIARDPVVAMLEAIPVLGEEPVPETTEGPSVADDDALRWRDMRLEEYIEEYMDRSAIADGPGGISPLCTTIRTRSLLIRANILTIAEVANRYLDGSLAEVGQIGPRRLKEIGDALSRLGLDDPGQQVQSTPAKASR